MKGPVIVALLVVAGAAAMVGVRLWMEEPASAEPVPVAVQNVEPAAEELVQPAPPAPAKPEAEEQEQEPEPAPELAAEPEIEQWQPDPQAVESLRRSMEEGDPRAPPIARRETEREMPTEAELADPELYLQYETRQQQKVYASFVQASDSLLALGQLWRNPCWLER